VPSQDIVLGLYYASREAINGKGEGMMFPDVSEAIRAWDNKEVELATRVTVRITEYPKDPATGEFVKTIKRYETTVVVRFCQKFCQKVCHSPC
jgi:DNA-directed RNA polymerase subunit beta'